MTLLSLLEGVDPRLLTLGLLLVLTPGAFLALVIAARGRSDSKAAATVRSVRPKHLPRNFTSGWDRRDEHGRTW